MSANWGIWEYVYEVGTYLDRVPVLAGEGVLGPLLEALLALRQSLVPIEQGNMSATTITLVVLFMTILGRRAGVAVLKRSSSPTWLILIFIHLDLHLLHPTSSLFLSLSTNSSPLPRYPPHLRPDLGSRTGR